MKDINVVNYTGRLGDTPVLQKTNSGKSVTTLNIAVQSNDSTDWFSCVAWEKTAELICQYAKKGNRIGVTGQNKTRTYDDRDGKKVKVVDLVIRDFVLLEKKEEQAAQQVQQDYPTYSYNIGRDDLPF